MQLENKFQNFLKLVFKVYFHIVFWLLHRFFFINIIFESNEIASTIVSLKCVTTKELSSAVNVLQLFISSPKSVLR
jgi:hypothetical protein